MFTGKRIKRNVYNVGWQEARFRGEEAGWVLRKCWALCAKNFIFDHGARGKHKGEESHGQICP